MTHPALRQRRPAPTVAATAAAYAPTQRLSASSWAARLALLALAGLPLAGQAQQADAGSVDARLQALTQRLQALEQRNQQLERQVSALPSAEEATPDEEGLSVEGGLVAVAQRSGAKGTGTGASASRLNYRGDLEFNLPMGNLRTGSEAQLKGFGHLRFGQGSGLALRPTLSATANSVPFEGAGGSDETYAIVAQAWLQATWPLAGSGLNDLPGNRVELTVGKMDVFGFFDQNAVAGDEGAQFLNNVFVHNPLLDSGGDIAADSYGLAPGVRLAYVDEGEERGWGWGVSAGVLAAGAGAGFNGGLGQPLVIVQAELTPKQINGEARGGLRLYGWTNGQTTTLDGSSPQRHSGWGLSADHKLGRDWQVFGRYGQRTAGDGQFDQALTLGFELGGRAWGLGHDALGLALGSLRTDRAWREATAADPSLVGFAATGREQTAELFYRHKLNEHIELSPDVQWIRHAGGDASAPTVTVWGLRANIGF